MVKISGCDVKVGSEAEDPIARCDRVDHEKLRFVIDDWLPRFGEGRTRYKRYYVQSRPRAKDGGPQASNRLQSQR